MSAIPAAFAGVDWDAAAQRHYDRFFEELFAAVRRQSRADVREAMAALRSARICERVHDLVLLAAAA